MRLALARKYFGEAGGLPVLNEMRKESAKFRTGFAIEWTLGCVDAERGRAQFTQPRAYSSTNLCMYRARKKSLYVVRRMLQAS